MPVHDAPHTTGAAPSLEALARRLPESDHAAFAEIYRRLQKPLVCYVQRFTPDRATAYDVLQDVFLKLWASRTTLQVHVSLKALLYTMARNRALNLNRRQSRSMLEGDVAALQDRNGAVPPVDATVEAAELARHLHAWIRALPPRRAEAFTLSRYHGLKHSEISTIMGLSERTVNTHILHALRDLRKRLDALQHTEPMP